jgi:hypothetical protein
VQKLDRPVRHGERAPRCRSATVDRTDIEDNWRIEALCLRTVMNSRPASCCPCRAMSDKSVFQNTLLLALR